MLQASEPQISSEEDEDDGDLKDWHCVVCNKTFRSEAAMANHERCATPLPPHSTVAV